ncbi:peptidoglycan D,D-transpeptidase FtsI family protein [Candidatus Formimonas warabiya]|uniref:beta-lactamase n=1 Tax=Formimonas warabiya TaxID=1761012 RepID=A0A3G1KNB1_FORW1|nr:penicillin-binding transpeptidase domain-containing protein [Candidatus Formimonas warabiya]ATW23981.1 hypothetical protein DCMF_03520 [Candidatus Formimonas warabiya]
MFLEKKRILAIYFVFLFFFTLLLGRLYQIQFLDGPGYTKQAVAQRQKTLNFVQYPRGEILDRNFRPLTNIEQQPCVVIFPIMVKDASRTAEVLSKILALPPGTIRAKIEIEDSASTQVVKEPFILQANVSEQKNQLIRQADLPGVYVLPLIPRYRPGWPAGHLLGYVGNLNQNEYQKLQEEEKDYQPSDVIGKNGLEKQYEEFLRGGTSQKVAALVDDRGRHLSGRGFTLLPPVQEKTEEPHQVITSIDADYQSVVEHALEGHSGAVVVMDVWKGNILAMASSPKYDPYLLEKPEADDAYLNKAMQNYPPASVFKILIAAAALTEGVVKPEDSFHCQGGITLPSGRIVSCWEKEGHGDISFSQALAFSCNPVFVETGLKLGGEKIMAYAKRLGLTDDTIIGYDLPQETHLDFNPAVPGDVANASIGENGISLSPVLVAKLISEVANGGLAVTPRLVLKVQDHLGKVVKEYPAPPSFPVLPGPVAERLKSMLALTVESGTGKSAQVPGIKCAGKTGSSERDEAWFAGFAPADAPRWAVVVFIHKGTSGGRDAAPIFQKIVSGLAEIEEIL